MPAKTIQSKYRATSIAVIIGLLLVAWQLFVAPLSQTFQYCFFGISLFAFGIQHGALDHVIEAEIARRKQGSFRLIAFLARYGIKMTLYAVFWYLIPQISFVFFILMSGWHFGETDIATNKEGWMAALAKLVFGVSVIGWILFSHPQEAGDIISRIIPPHQFLYQVWLLAVRHTQVMLTACGVSLATLILLSIRTTGGLQTQKLFINLLLILSCCSVLPLLPSFALYFAGWHSVITLYNITVFIQNENGDGKGRAMIWKLWLQALPLSLTAMAGLILTGYFLQHYAPLFEPLPLIFVFLSLITLPHAGVMYQLNKRLSH